MAVEQSNIIVLTDCPISLDYFFHISFFLRTFPRCVAIIVLLHPSSLESTSHCALNRHKLYTPSLLARFHNKTAFLSLGGLLPVEWRIIIDIPDMKETSTKGISKLIILLNTSTCTVLTRQWGCSSYPVVSNFPEIRK